MPAPQKAILSATGASAPMGLDWTASPFAASVNVFLPGGVTATFGLEYTLDDVASTPPANVRWVSDTGAGNLPTGSTAGGTVRYTTPVAAVRLNVASLAGGNIELRVLQA